MTIQLTPDTLQAMLNEAGKLGGIRALAESGVTTGEITQREAFDRFGRRWMEAQIAAGRLAPSRVGNGRNGARRYDVATIMALRASESIAADLIRTTL